MRAPPPPTGKSRTDVRVKLIVALRPFSEVKVKVAASARHWRLQYEQAKLRIEQQPPLFLDRGKIYRDIYLQRYIYIFMYIFLRQASYTITPGSSLQQSGFFSPPPLLCWRGSGCEVVCSRARVLSAAVGRSAGSNLSISSRVITYQGSVWCRVSSDGAQPHTQTHRGPPRKSTRQN